jgi:hypothetical protein
VCYWRCAATQCNLQQLVAFVAERLGSFAKAKKTRTANRELLYEQWAIFKPLSKYLDASPDASAPEVRLPSHLKTDAVSKSAPVACLGSADMPSADGLVLVA